MEFLVKLFFEDLVLLLLAEFVALAVMLAIHRRRYTPQSRRNVWLTLGICAALLAVQFLVETDAEKVKALVVRLVDAVDEGDMNTIEDCVHPDGVRVGTGTSAESFPKDVFVMGCNIGLQMHRINEAQVGDIQVDLSGDEALVDFYLNCEISSTTQGDVGFNQSVWQIVCARTSGGWKMRQITRGEIGSAVLSNIPRMPVLRYIREMSERALQQSRP